MTSSSYAIIPARDNWFQTNQPDHELDDRALLLCVLPMRKIWFQTNQPDHELDDRALLLCVLPMRKIWFQTNQPDHELDDRALLLCVLPMRKIWLFSFKIWLIFVPVLWFSKTVITDGTQIWVFVRVLWDVISKIYWQFESSYNYCPIEIMWRKIVRSVCLTPVSMQCEVCIHHDVSLYQRTCIMSLIITRGIGQLQHRPLIPPPKKIGFCTITPWKIIGNLYNLWNFGLK